MSNTEMWMLLMFLFQQISDQCHCVIGAVTDTEPKKTGQCSHCPQRHHGPVDRGLSFRLSSINFISFIPHLQAGLMPHKLKPLLCYLGQSFLNFLRL